MTTIPLVWTNDDILFGQTEQLKRQLAFLDRHGIPGVFFLVPRAGEKTLGDDADLLRAIDSARGRGHEFYQHGYVHTAFECGVPETWMLDFDPKTRRAYDAQRLEIEAGHTVESLVEMLERGRRIWRRAFGDDSLGFRPGWGGFCGNLYRALEILGFDWVSSRCTCPTSWMWNQGQWDYPLDFREGVPLGPTKLGRLMEFPLAGDYAFRVPDDPGKIQSMVELAQREFSHYLEQEAPMLIVSHWHGLERDGGTGYAVHEKLIPKLLGTGRAEPMGMAKLAAEVRGRALDQGVEERG